MIPADPKTPSRLQARENLRAVSRAWSQWLNEDERQQWNLSGPRVLSRRRLTRGKLTGQALFVNLNTARAWIGRDLLRRPPQRPVFPPNPVVGLSIGYQQGRLRLKVSVSGPVEGDPMVFAQAPCPAARKKSRKPVFLCLLPPPENGESDITDQYVARFGEPSPGRKVFTLTRQQINGWEDRPVELSAVVPQPERLQARGSR